MKSLLTMVSQIAVPLRHMEICSFLGYLFRIPKGSGIDTCGLLESRFLLRYDEYVLMK